MVWSAGYGPQKLATLAAYALRRNLLDWLETFKVEKVCAERMRSQAEQLKASFLHSKLIQAEAICSPQSAALSRQHESSCNGILPA